MINKKMITMFLIPIFSCSLGMSSSIAHASSLPDNAGMASSAYQKADVTIDGQLQSFDQSAVIVGDYTMVPLRGVFESLGATISWSQQTQTVTATKGNTTIVLTVGQNYAYVNGSKIALAAKSQIINGSTMVPLRFVAESLGANVGWNQNTNTATISNSSGNGNNGSGPVEQPGGSQVVNGIKVQYGKHTYLSKNQSEYDTVIDIANKAIKDNADLTLPSSYVKYIKGDRASNYSYGSDEARGLTFAEQKIGSLVKAGLSQQEIEKVYKASIIAGDLVEGQKDNGTAQSAYDSLVGKSTTCYSDAHVQSLIFDIFGFNTSILGGKDHADMYVYVGTSWYKVTAGAFMKFDMPSKLPSGAIIYAQPTYGAELSK